MTVKASHYVACGAQNYNWVIVMRAVSIMCGVLKLLGQAALEHPDAVAVCGLRLGQPPRDGVPLGGRRRASGWRSVRANCDLGLAYWNIFSPPCNWAPQKWTLAVFDDLLQTTTDILRAPLDPTRNLFLKTQAVRVRASHSPSPSAILTERFTRLRDVHHDRRALENQFSRLALGSHDASSASGCGVQLLGVMAEQFPDLLKARKAAMQACFDAVWGALAETFALSVLRAFVQLHDSVESALGCIRQTFSLPEELRI